MDDVPYDIFLNIGKQLTSTEEYEPEHIHFQGKTVEEYKKDYRNKLELQLANIKKQLFELEIEIMELERKNSKLLYSFSNKGYNSTTRTFLYNNKILLNYFLSLNNLDSDKFKLNLLTIQSLNEQHNAVTDIYNRTLFFLDKLLNNV